MIDLTNIHKADPKTQNIFFVHGYGNFLLLWGSFELVLEIVIMRQLKLKPLQASIVCTNLGGGEKRSLAISLLRLKPKKNKTAIGLIKQAWSIAQRNDFAHAFYNFDRPTANYVRLNRNAQDGYTVKKTELNAKVFLKQIDNFIRLMQEAQAELRITSDDINAYTRPILAHALKQEDQEARLQQRRANAAKANGTKHLQDAKAPRAKQSSAARRRTAMDRRRPS